MLIEAISLVRLTSRGYNSIMQSSNFSSVATHTILDIAENREMTVSTAELRRTFDRDGVVVMPGFLTESQVLPLRRELDSHYAPLAATAATSHNGAGIPCEFRVRRYGLGSPAGA